MTSLSAISDVIVSSHRPVQRDAAEVKDGRCRQLDVQRRPDQAEDLSVPPVAGGQLNRSEGHHHQGDQQVSKRQRHDEVVCLLLPERKGINQHK